MISVFVRSDSHYPIERKRIRQTIERVLTEKSAEKGKIEVSVSVVGDRMMRTLNNKYRNLNETTDVLSFALSEGKERFVEAPDGILRLGDVVVSYPQAVTEASEENKMVDDKIDELIEHGILHLLGQHHE